MKRLIFIIALWVVSCQPLPAQEFPEYWKLSFGYIGSYGSVDFPQGRMWFNKDSLITAIDSARWLKHTGANKYFPADSFTLASRPDTNLAKQWFNDTVRIATGKPVMFGAIPLKDTLGIGLKAPYFYATGYLAANYGYQGNVSGGMALYNAGGWVTILGRAANNNMVMLCDSLGTSDTLYGWKVKKRSFVSLYPNASFTTDTLAARKRVQAGSAYMDSTTGMVYAVRCSVSGKVALAKDTVYYGVLTSRSPADFNVGSCGDTVMIVRRTVKGKNEVVIWLDKDGVWHRANGQAAISENTIVAPAKTPAWIIILLILMGISNVVLWLRQRK